MAAPPPPIAFDYANGEVYQIGTTVTLRCTIEGTVKNEHGERFRWSLGAGNVVIISDVRRTNWELTNAGRESGLDAREVTGYDVTYAFSCFILDRPWYKYGFKYPYGIAPQGIPHSSLAVSERGGMKPSIWEEGEYAYVTRKLEYNFERAVQTVSPGEIIHISSEPLTRLGNDKITLKRGSEGKVHYLFERATKVLQPGVHPVWESSNFYLPGVFRA